MCKPDLYLLAGLTAKQRDFVIAIDANTEGLDAVSTGVCPGCETCRDEYGPDMSEEEFDEALSSGKIVAEPFFSWHGCDLCGSSLGGNFEPWYAVDKNGEITHGDRACVDCVVYLANGDLPGQNDE